MADSDRLPLLKELRDRVAKAPIRTYEVTLRGWPPHPYSARSPAKARVQCWRAYSAYDDRCDFKSFLKLVQSVRVVADPPGIGERILVCGRPATRVLGGIKSGRANYFMWDDGDEILTAHPSEIARAEATETAEE